MFSRIHSRLTTQQTDGDDSQVVVDPTINPSVMEMYADVDARGGVLEPEGIVNIKYRRDKQLDTMSRLDPTYRSLRDSLSQPGLTSEQSSDIKIQITEREALLLPVYAQISLQFADLHDRAGRMEAKGVIRMPLRWKESRRFFYWRLRRRLNEEGVIRRMESIRVTSSGSSHSHGRSSSSSSSAVAPSSSVPTPTATATGAPTSTSTSTSTTTTITASQSATSTVAAHRTRHMETLQAWSNVANFATDDRAVATWYEDNRKLVNAKVESLRHQGIATEVAGLLLGTNRDAGLKGVRDVLSMMPVAEREAVLKMLGGT